MLIPTWFLLVVWVLRRRRGGARLDLTNDLAAPALIGGLVLIVMLIGFTIMQSAFAAGGVAQGAIGADAERRALAMTGCGDAIFDWNVTADRIYVSAEIEDQLGLKRGALEGPAASWLDMLHPLDRDRYSAGARRACCSSARGRISHDFRLRGADGHYLWFRLQGAPGGQRRRRRGAGHRRARRRHRDQDRRRAHAARRDPRQPHRPAQPRIVLRPAGARADRPGRDGPARRRPTVLAIDIDRFKRDQRRARHVVRRFGRCSTVARRLGRELQAGRHAGAHRRRPVRRHRHVRRHRGRADRQRFADSHPAHRWRRRSASATARSR